MNNIIIKGRITADPELKSTSNGVEVCNFSVAVDRNYQAKDTEKITDFFNCTAWRKTGAFINTYFKKGQEILIIGEMQSQKYADKDGNNRTAWVLVVNKAEFCGSKSDNGEVSKKSPDVSNDDFEDVALNDDDLPF